MQLFSAVRRRTGRFALSFAAFALLASAHAAPIPIPAPSGERAFWSLVLLAEPEKTETWLPVLEKSEGLRIAAAWAPRELSALTPQRDRLMKLRQQDRLDPALELAGEPPLAVIYDLELARNYMPAGLVGPASRIAWPDDVTARIARGRALYKGFWGHDPLGFVPGGGSLQIGIVEFLKNQKFGWTVGGFPEEEWEAGNAFLLSSGPSEQILVYSAHPISRYLYPEPGADLTVWTPPSLKETVAKVLKEVQGANRLGFAPVVVYDERHSWIPAAELLGELQRQLQEDDAPQMILPREVPSRQSPQSISTTLQVWPYSWDWLSIWSSNLSAGLGAWLGAPEKNAAWDLLAQTRSVIEEYKNSGNADVRRLDRALDELYVAESGDFFQWFGTDPRRLKAVEPGAEQKKSERAILFNATLANVYRHLNLPVPASLKGMSLSRAAAAEPSVSTSAHLYPTPLADLKVSLAPNFVAWQVQGDPVVKGFDEWLQKLAVQVLPSEDKVKLSLTFQSDGQHPGAADIYIDINRRDGAGRTTLLEGRGGILPPRDAWEYALTMRRVAGKSWEARLFRATTAQPIWQATIQAQAHGYKGSLVTLDAKVPKSLIGRDPLRWGFLSCIMDQDGDPITDFLGSSSNKKWFFSQLKSSPTRSAAEDVLMPMLRAGND